MKFLIFGGGGKVARHFAQLAVGKGDEVISVVRNEDHLSDLKEIGAKPHVLSLEDCTVPDLTALLSETEPDAIVFSAGAGGKGDKSRTRKVDYEGAVKVYDAMESSNVRRLLYVGAMDIRDRQKPKPEWYTSDDEQMSDRMWKAIPEYMQAKYDAEMELHARKQLAYTVIRPGGLTLEPARGCTMGRTPLVKTSRELVAQVLLASAKDPKTEGMTIDVIDGENTVEDELAKVVQNRLDSWTG